MKNFDKLLIIIGSCKSAKTIKNPFSYIDRCKMVIESLTITDLERVKIRGITDTLYSDTRWITDLQTIW